MDRKKEIRSMKNRESAVKSRQKKQELIEQLSSQVRLYTSEIIDTRSINTVLREYLSSYVDMNEVEIFSKPVQRFLEPAVFLF